MLSNDNSQEVIEIIKEDKKPQSLVKILIVMFVSIALLGVAVIGGLKFYKQYKNKKLEITEQPIPLEPNNTYVESLAMPQHVPGPPQLKIPENLEKPMPIKKVEENITDTTDYSKLPYMKNQVEPKVKEKTLEEKLKEISSFDELKDAIIPLKIRRIENEVIVGDKIYKIGETLGGNFIIKKIYRNGNVKIFSIQENYSRRFSL